MTLQNTNISHLGKRKIIDSKVPAGRGHRTVPIEGFEGNHYQSPWHDLHEWLAKLGTVPCFHSRQATIPSMPNLSKPHNLRKTAGFLQLTMNSTWVTVPLGKMWCFFFLGGGWIFFPSNVARIDNRVGCVGSFLGNSRVCSPENWHCWGKPTTNEDVSLYLLLKLRWFSSDRHVCFRGNIKVGVTKLRELP